jgi:divalent metal cation (Fe/Co/Zn/Cd) transporter
MTDAIKKSVRRVESAKIERVRLRSAGSHYFVELKISLDRSMSLESSRDVVSEVEAKVREIIADADIVVQVEPRTIPDESLSSKINLISLKERGIRHVHNIRVQKIGKEVVVDLHVEVNPNLTIREAHEIVSNFEDKMKSQLGIKEVNAHIETHRTESEFEKDLTNDYPNLVRKIKEIAQRYPEIKDCHDVSIRRIEGRISASLHCVISADKSVSRAHELTTDLEHTLKVELMGLDYVTIHVEPEA